MRRIIFILLIALLPLRGWAAEAMATQMAIKNAITQGHNASTFAADKSTVATMSPECAMRMNASIDDKDVVDTACADCQACHMIALKGVVQVRCKLTDKLAHESLFAVHYTSAEPQFSLKPPIFSA